VRIDRTDPSDGPGNVHMGRRVGSAADNLHVTSKDKGTIEDGGGPPDSSLGRYDSSLRTERTMAYRAVVDAAYRQYAIDYSDARARTLEREAASSAVSRTDVEDPEGLVRLTGHPKGNGQPVEAARKSSRATDDTSAQLLRMVQTAPSTTNPLPHQVAKVASVTAEAHNPPQAIPHPTPRATTTQKV
jgi:hypothetical protein